MRCFDDDYNEPDERPGLKRCLGLTAAAEVRTNLGMLFRMNKMASGLVYGQGL